MAKMKLLWFREWSPSLKGIQFVTSYCFQDSASSRVSQQGMQVSSTGGDSSYSWVFVHALGHNLGQE